MPSDQGREEWMRAAIAAARDGMRADRGGPFGAVIVRGEEIVARGCNEVTSTNDPTAHAEVVAIRAAAHALGNPSLEGCTIYTSCEPCPMCLAAINWARLDQVFFASTSADAAKAGFDDARFYEEVCEPPAKRALPAENFLRDEAWSVMQEWIDKPDKATY